MAVEEARKANEDHESAIDEIAKTRSEKNTLQEQLTGAQNLLNEIRARDEQVDNIDELIRLLIDGRYELVYNPESNKSKWIEFKNDGSIGEGNNKNEYRWNVNSDGLRIFNESGDLQNCFRYQVTTGRFVARGGLSAEAQADQFLVPQPADT